MRGGYFSHNRRTKKEDFLSQKERNILANAFKVVFSGYTVTKCAFLRKAKKWRKMYSSLEIIFDCRKKHNIYLQ